MTSQDEQEQAELRQNMLVSGQKPGGIDTAATISDLQAQLEGVVNDKTEWLCEKCNCVYLPQRKGILQPCPKCGNAMRPSSVNIRKLEDERAEHNTTEQRLEQTVAKLNHECRARVNADKVAAEFQTRFLDERKAREEAELWSMRFWAAIDAMK